MKADLDEFRTNVCKALLFINICFFVFSVTMKSYSADLPQFSLPLPITFLRLIIINNDNYIIDTLSKSTLISFDCNNIMYFIYYFIK